MSEEIPSFNVNEDSTLTANQPTEVSENVTAESGPVPASTKRAEDDAPETNDEDVTKVQIVEPSAVKPNAPETEQVDTDFYYPTHTDPARKLPKTSLYLDDQQRLEAEVVRAKIEQREPDLDNPPAVQGTPLYTKAQISHAGNPVAVTVPPAVTLPVVQVKG